METTNIKKSYTPEFKSKVALELVREMETTTQICSKYQIHPTQAGQWKQRLLSSSHELFGDRASAQKIAELEQEKSNLFATVGKLSYELDWLKKRAPNL